MKKERKGEKGGKVDSPQKKQFNADDYVTLTLPRQEVIQLRRAFEIFDQDGSGIVDSDKLLEAYAKSNFFNSNRFKYQVMVELDTDHSGGINFAQFLRLATGKISEKDSRTEINKVFNSFTSNYAGKFTFDELKRVFKSIGETMSSDEIFHIFQNADLDDDGFVTSDDFYNIMTHKVYWD